MIFALLIFSLVAPPGAPTPKNGAAGAPTLEHGAPSAPGHAMLADSGRRFGTAEACADAARNLLVDFAGRPGTVAGAACVVWPKDPQT